MSSCDHEVGEDTDIEVVGPGHIVSECRLCGRGIVAASIDHEYFKDTGEVVVLEWEVP